MVKKAVILAAGKGTRMESLTNGSSKEMVLVNNEPVISLVIQEALSAGCAEVAVVIAKDKEDLQTHLEHEQKKGMPITILYQEPTGMSDAILASESFVNGEFFLLLLPDMHHLEKPNLSQQLASFCDEQQSAAVGLFKEKSYFGKGVRVFLGEEMGTHVYPVLGTTTDPEKSLIRFFGRYVFPSTVFNYIREIGREESEVPLLNYLVEHASLHGILVEQQIYDTGIPEGYEHFKKQVEKQ